MKKSLLLTAIAFLIASLQCQKSYTQSPGNVGTTNLKAWFNPVNLPLGYTTTWTTTFPTGTSALTLTDATTPFPYTTNTPSVNVANYNKTISFVGNTIAAPMSLELPGTLNLLDNNTSTSQGTMFAVYYMKPAALVAQQLVDYRESGGDAIQLRWLNSTTSRLALGTSNSVNGTRDYSEGEGAMLISYSGNKSSSTSLKCRKRSLEWTNNPVSSSASTSPQLGLTIGSRKNTSGVYSGMNESFVSELIFFNTNLSATDNIKVESYLAIKYGITLDASGTSVGSYLASNANSIWNASSALTYHNNIIGIARDDNSLLNQKQSHSLDDSTRIYKGAIAASNDDNTSTFLNNVSYLMLGNNLGGRKESATASAEIPSGQNILNRIEREWRITNTNMSDTFNVDIALNSLTNFTSNTANLCLLIDDDGNFTNATVYTPGQLGLGFSVSGNIISIGGLSSSHFPLNTTKYFTLAYFNPNLLPLAGSTTSSFASPVCENTPFTLSLTGATTFSSQTYQWESSANNITYTPISGANAATYTTSINTPTYFRCEITLNSDSSTSTEILLNTNALPTVTATPTTQTKCENETTSIAGGGASSYVWSGGITNATAFTVTANNTYTITGTDANGCSNTASAVVNMNSLPTVTATPTTQTLCENQSASIAGGGASSYVWSGGISNATAFTVTANNTYTVTGTDANGCSNTASAVVNMNSLPTVTATPTTQTLCENQSASIAGGGASSYVWSGGISDNSPFSVTANNTYTVTGTDANGCSNTASAVVNMNAAPIVTSTATTNNTCNNTSVTLNGGGASSYVWSGGVSNNTPFVATTSNITYTVTGTDAIGCSATSSTTIATTASSSTLAPLTTLHTQIQNDDFNLSYYDASCNLIASVDDGMGGNILGTTTATVNVDANAGIHNSQPFVRRWYQITPSNNIGVAANVTLYISQSDFDNYNTIVALPYLPMPTSGDNTDPNIVNIRITKNSDAGLGNNPVVITPSVNWNGLFWELNFPTTSFSQFRIHSVNPSNIPLPTTLANFTGNIIEQGNLLKWSTASEKNNAYFNLQHSLNGIDFSNIARINTLALNGNSETTINYNFKHINPTVGHNYYRLEQVDIDNHSYINSQIVDLENNKNGSSVSVFPNPVNNELTVNLFSSKEQHIKIQLRDMSGRIIKEIKSQSNIGKNEYKIIVDELSNGLYTVQVFENNILSHVLKINKGL